jgi:hypothetical protein
VGGATRDPAREIGAPVYREEEAELDRPSGVPELGDKVAIEDAEAYPSAEGIREVVRGGGWTPDEYALLELGLYGS